jgi:FtsH-binding integral membrane protein
MIGTRVAAWLMFLFFAFSGVVGLLLGLAVAVATRRRWTLQVAWTDAAVSAITALVFGYAIYTVEAARGNWESHNGLIILLASGAVLLKHGIELVFLTRKSP